MSDLPASVERQNRERSRIENRGARASRHVMREIQNAAMDAVQMSVNPATVVRPRVQLMVPIMRDALVASHLRGLWRSHIAAQVALRTRRKKAMAAGVYTEVINFLRQRIDMSDAEITALRVQYGAVAVAVADQTSNAIERSIQTTLRNIRQEQLIGREGLKRFRRALARNGVTSLSSNVIETAFRTQTAIGYSVGRQRANAEPEIDEILFGYSYHTVGDDRVRPTHAAMDGVRAPKDDPIWQTWFPPAGFNCFVPETAVSGAITGATRAWYDGPIAVIKTRKGMRLAVTVNHPIATRHGWVAAQDIKRGDNLVCHFPTIESLISASLDNGIASPFIPLGAIDNQDMPSSIKNVFDALARNGVKPIVANTAPLDFHGDAARFDGEIDIVHADGMLHGHADSGECKDVMKPSDMLVPDAANATGHCFGHFNLFSGGSDAPASSRPSGPALSGDGAVGVAAGLDAIPLDPLLLGRGAQLNASVAEDSIDRLAGYPIFLRQLIDAGSGDVGFDDVVFVEIRDFRGHVYDLQSVSSDRTGNGWIISQGIVTSNCRCTTTEIYNTDHHMTRTRRLPPTDIVVDDQRIPVEPDEGFSVNFADVFTV